MSNPCLVMHQAVGQQYFKSSLTGCSVDPLRDRKPVIAGTVESVVVAEERTTTPRNCVTDTSDMSEAGDSRGGLDGRVRTDQETTFVTDANQISVHGQSSSSESSVASTLPQHAFAIRLGEAGGDDEFQMRVQENRDILLRQLSLTLESGRLTLINLSRRGLQPKDAVLVKEAIGLNPNLTVLKLGYNDFGDSGVATIATGFIEGGRHHQSLSALDLGFNSIGDDGCATLALHAVAGNETLNTLFLSGNNIGEKGVVAIAGAILHGGGLRSLHLSANKVGTTGVQILARAIAERESHVPKVQAGMKRPRTMEQLHLSGTQIGSEGFVTIPSMLLTNASMRVLGLANNELDDNDIALLAQSLSRNKSVPLEILQLSFNLITCVGVECIMNAVWASKTLRELRFDNNRIRDRGAQLAAVALTSIDLELIDISFNKVTSVGIKAMMKSLSENSTIRHLGLSGIPVDLNAAKALSYGLAYNSTLTTLNIDSCSIGYSAQRHLVAGIVSNRYAALKILTGFNIGAITVTLGLPHPLEQWSNDQVLTFIRLMWNKWRDEQGLSSRSDAGVASGPAAPAVVVAAAKRALSLVGELGGSSLKTEPHQRQPADASPLVHTNAALLEKTLSGTVRVPPIVEGVESSSDGQRIIEAWTETTNQNRNDGSPIYGGGLHLDPVQKQRNLQWLRSHFRALHEIARLPFKDADLWQLHQHFFSPLVEVDDGETTPARVASGDSEEVAPQHLEQPVNVEQTSAPLSSPPATDATQRSELHRALSFQVLAESASADHTSTHSRRRSLATMEGGDYDDDDDDDDDVTSSTPSEEFEPASKRAKNFKPRIAYYPRIRRLLESLGNKASQDQMLSLLRQLKFVERVMFEGKDVYLDSETIREPSQPMPADIEMVLLDLL